MADSPPTVEALLDAVLNELRGDRDRLERHEIRAIRELIPKLDTVRETLNTLTRNHQDKADIAALNTLANVVDGIQKNVESLIVDLETTRTEKRKALYGDNDKPGIFTRLLSLEMWRADQVWLFRFVATTAASALIAAILALAKSLMP